MMGTSDSKYILESELSSDSESSSDEYDSPLEEINEPIGTTDDSVVTIDAALRKPISLPRAKDVLNLEKVLRIEEQLELDEIVSLVFLLLDGNPVEMECYLQDLILLLEGSSKKLLYDWAVIQETRAESNWQNKLIESLCIIKNYAILKSLGFDKMNVELHYLPNFKSTLHINEMRKVAYLMCDNFDSQKTATFLDHARREFQERNIYFHELDPQFLELYLMHWETTKSFTLTDVKRILKIMDEERLYTMLENILDRNNIQMVKETLEPFPSIRFESVQCSSRSDDVHQNSQTLSNDLFESHFPSNKMSRDRKCSTTSMDNHVQQEYVDSNHTFMDYQLGLTPRSTNSDMASMDNRYFIDPSRPGVVLIINQEEFHTEINPMYRHLLPPNTREKLVSRKGTERDRVELECVFENFGFKVIVRENINHIDMIQTIKDVVNGVEDDSSLFVCILSHGDKGVVYGSNSCMVAVNRIHEIMHKTNKKNLVGKPKVLILQSCQGHECQTLDENEGECEEHCLTTDGPASLLRDMVTFYATIPGYAAIRSKQTGSWFIQALCNQMMLAGHELHFSDICTRTANEVTKLKWIKDKDRKVMTPLMESTLLKSFFLPPLKKTNLTQ